MDKTKILALYLPQYYETNYNSDWWVQGYTEWTACKQAIPLFKGHYQPKVPLNNHYYDLSRKEEIQSQIEMAKKYGIDGFVIYQYYSCNESEYGDKNGIHGSMLLNKPTEIVRESPKLNIPFCMYWANHDWRKMWFGQNPKMLWPQYYGDEADWKEFFLYNLAYFKDNRYIKVNNKPVYFIFAAWHFKEIEKFMDCWNQWAKENGFDGIFFVKTEDAHTSDQLGQFDAVYRREPFYTFAKGFSKFDFVLRLLRTRTSKLLNRVLNKVGKGLIGYTCDYDKAWQSIITREDIGPLVIPGAFADWDNTARKRYNAQIIKGADPIKFRKYLKLLMDKCCEKQVPFIVINAWNEWAEGAYLEPDEKNAYAYLEAIENVQACRRMMG
ncbi:glycoside hydrolase family 99-like domain-containing protein [Desulfosporosinus meridiei]|uniref:Glycosyltransferase WbsX n=1 Tax=Desulfosporosinus meridiei (strain ATCC BAA-275 / DSM 13257 / KCTC 12902 / NCIMB 13706 / S10) TaxID=768704 RepID=J7J4V8_DESMD|nr:glycoside hydrolase family 99-like domain-containing protein [Desulfosporosinus meridiei]AFQ45986.1 hypothetical protein Desmer_4158 [Desulfosporosinus meridiei DSM 13257]